MCIPKKILMPTDFSNNANQALRYAVMLVDKFECQLILFHVVPLHGEDPNAPGSHFPDLQEFYRQLETHAKDRMREIKIAHAPLAVDEVTVRGISPAEQIVGYAAENGVDLIVMGTHGRSALAHFLVGSVAENVVRHATCPVITVAHQEEEIFEPPRLKRLLVPIDFSEHARAALPHVVIFAQNFDAEIELLHVIDQRVYPSFYGTEAESLMRLYPELMDKSIAELKSFAGDDIPEDLQIEFTVREGNPQSEIIRYADKQDVDLIMMGTHGLSGLEKVLIGSTAEKVVRRAECPVFVIKAPSA